MHLGSPSSMPAWRAHKFFVAIYDAHVTGACILKLPFIWWSSEGRWDGRVM